MKKISLTGPGIVVCLGALLFFSCQNSAKKYTRARALENNAMRMLNQNNPDSGRQYATESISLYKELLSHADSLHDTLYTPGLAVTYNYLGLFNDTLGQSDKALNDYLESLKYAKIAGLPYTRLYAEENISYLYLRSARAAAGNPENREKFIALSHRFLMAACHDADSAGGKGKTALDLYYQACHSFYEMGDSVNGSNYARKFIELKEGMNPAL